MNPRYNKELSDLIIHAIRQKEIYLTYQGRTYLVQYHLSTNIVFLSTVDNGAAFAFPNIKVAKVMEKQPDNTYFEIKKPSIQTPEPVKETGSVNKLPTQNPNKNSLLRDKYKNDDYIKQLVASMKTITADPNLALNLLEQFDLDKYDINFFYEENNTLMHIAIQHVTPENTDNTLKVLNCLAKLGADINARTKEGFSILDTAIMRKSEKIAEFSLHRCADPNVKNAEDWSAIYFAISSHQLKLVQLLVHYHADITLRLRNKQHSCTPIQYANYYKLHDIAAYLKLELDKLNNNQENDNSKSQLRQNTIKKLILFLQKNDTKNICDTLEELKEGNKFKWNINLLRNGFVQFNKLNFVMAAAYYGMKEVVVKCVELGADLFLKTEYNENILHFAAKSNNVELIRYLLEQGVSPLQQHLMTRELPLHDAIFHGCIEAAQILAQHSPETILFKVTVGGKTAIDLTTNNSLKVFFQNLKTQITKRKIIVDPSTDNIIKAMVAEENSQTTVTQTTNAMPLTPETPYETPPTPATPLDFGENKKRKNEDTHNNARKKAKTQEPIQEASSTGSYQIDKKKYAEFIKVLRTHKTGETINLIGAYHYPLVLDFISCVIKNERPTRPSDTSKLQHQSESSDQDVSVVQSDQNTKTIFDFSILKTIPTLFSIPSSIPKEIALTDMGLISVENINSCDEMLYINSILKKMPILIREKKAQVTRFFIFGDKEQNGKYKLFELNHLTDMEKQTLDQLPYNQKMLRRDDPLFSISLIRLLRNHISSKILNQSSLPVEENVDLIPCHFKELDIVLKEDAKCSSKKISVGIVELKTISKPFSNLILAYIATPDEAVLFNPSAYKAFGIGFARYESGQDDYVINAQNLAEKFNFAEHENSSNNKTIIFENEIHFRPVPMPTSELNFMSENDSQADGSETRTTVTTTSPKR